MTNFKTQDQNSSQALGRLESAENALNDAQAVAALISDLLLPQTDSGQVSIRAEGLFLMMKNIQDKCTEARIALATLRPHLVRSPT